MTFYTNFTEIILLHVEMEADKKCAHNCEQNCWKAATFKNKMMMEEQYKDLRNKL
jgi:hypothetical protein